MQRLFIALLLVLNVYGEGPEIPDLEEFTPPVSIRSAYSGDIVGFGEDRNWVLRDIPLTDDMLRDDPFKDFHLGAVQFVQLGTQDTCLAIDESGFFTRKSCQKDLESKKYETLYTIIPTTTPAVQIRSFVLEKNECMTVFNNPTLPSGRGIGIRPCDVDSSIPFVDLSNLFLLNPPIRQALLINP
ncbi:toxin [Helicobacter himalayensis]|uniref:toxin n=1 Tax=Helicobacter himalayensis TaxID=1591088 RepID=UPI00082F6A39|nr:toxin [Helicobacter himalayensis]